VTDSGGAGGGWKDGRVSCNREVLVRERKGLFHRAYLLRDASGFFGGGGR
jgi:hypothetical protein